MQLGISSRNQVSKSKRVVTAAGCVSCGEHIQKGRLHMQTETMMAGSRRLQGELGLGLKRTG